MLAEPFSRRDFEFIRQRIYAHSGIWLAENKTAFLTPLLNERLVALQLTTIAEYCQRLRDEAELALLLDALTVKESWFYREMEPVLAWLELIRTRPLPQHPLRVWSVGCSTGEEPYTLAMLFAESLPTFEIYATDLTTSAIAQAKRAQYDERSLRHLPDAWRTRYFTQHANQWHLAEPIRARVRFETHNLIGALGARRGYFDLALCRNVIIYFDEMSRGKALQNLHDALRPDGHLILGQSETLAQAPAPFELARVKTSLLLKRRAHG